MAFNIVVQTSNSEPNKVTKNITDIATLSGELKAGTSIIDPVFTVVGNMDDYKNCNYCTVSTFGRSYFVRNIRSIRTGLIELTCHVDVLSSFKTPLLTNKAIIRRQELKFNKYVDDGAFKIYQNPMITTQPFPNGFTAQEFVFVVAGAQNANTDEQEMQDT